MLLEQRRANVALIQIVGFPDSYSFARGKDFPGLFLMITAEGLVEAISPANVEGNRQRRRLKVLQARINDLQCVRLSCESPNSSRYLRFITEDEGTMENAEHA